MVMGDVRNEGGQVTIKGFVVGSVEGTRQGTVIDQTAVVRGRVTLGHGYFGCEKRLRSR